jgi:hypothetical protein
MIVVESGATGGRSQVPGIEADLRVEAHVGPRVGGGG